MPATLLDVTAGRADAHVARGTLLRRFIEAYWLRPENALWMTLRSETLARVAFRRPSADLSCGDGIFSFLHLGGAFDPAFDVFAAVDHLDRIRDAHADMFDARPVGYDPPVLKRPADEIDFGTDCKQNLLNKAEKLDFYRRLILHDSNLALPFADGSIATLYCNAAYWVREIEVFLSELARVVRPGGRVVLQVKLDSMQRYTLEAHRSTLGDRFLDIIGRGRMDCWPTLTDRSTWETRFARAGFTIQEAAPFITRTHAHVWDIGLRPIAPQLVRMANALTPATRAEIKRDWVDLFVELLSPLCNSNLDLMGGHDEPAEMQYVLAVR